MSECGDRIVIHWDRREADMHICHLPAGHDGPHSFDDGSVLTQISGTQRGEGVADRRAETDR